uniref:Uncharacterized protein n=1 Tax=Opuntia streptacantha TaxID=393608 RepID=A0A7C8YVA0_OPUST
MAKVAMMATTTGTTTTNVGASDTETEQTPPNPTIFRDFLSGTAATVHGTQPSASSPPASDRQMGSLVERISCFGPRNDHSKAEISNRLAGSKRSNSASIFMCSSREAFHQTNPESSHAMKILCKASGRERLIGTGHETSLHGAPQTRLFSSFMSRPTGNMPNLPQSERQYTSCIAQSSVSYQIPPSRFRDGSSGPPVLSELASDEGSQTGNKGSGILNSINASKVITERRPLTLLPNGGKPPSHSADPESSNIPR